jgi:hypothetical protein
MKLVFSLQVYPIRGKRYKCQDCTELIGFDLCEACYNSSSNLPGRFNQQHTPDHRMEADETALLPRLLRFHGIPEEGPEDLMLQEVVIDPGAMVQFFAANQEMENNAEEAAAAAPGPMEQIVDNQEMENNGEEAAAAPGPVVQIVVHNQEMEDSGEEDHPH